MRNVRFKFLSALNVFAVFMPLPDLRNSVSELINPETKTAHANKQHYCRVQFILCEFPTLCHFEEARVSLTVWFANEQSVTSLTLPYKYLRQ